MSGGDDGGDVGGHDGFEMKSGAVTGEVIAGRGASWDGGDSDMLDPPPPPPPRNRRTPFMRGIQAQAPAPLRLVGGS